MIEADDRQYVEVRFVRASNLLTAGRAESVVASAQVRDAGGFRQ
jgi:hypothetical protein